MNASVGTAPSNIATGWHYDGRSATRHRVRVVPSADGFVLEGPDIASGPHRWRDLAALGGTGHRSVYGLKGVDGWRLIFDGPPPPNFAIHLPLPARYGRWIDRIGFTRAVIAFAAIAAGVVAVVVSAPAWLAPLVPRSLENRLGDAMAGDFGGHACRTPQGRAALVQLAETLGAREAGVRSIEVVDGPMVNAMAMPGGRIIIFDGLLKQARSADEMAGVLAHEIAHVRHRDTMAGLIRQLGLGVILGGFNGKAAGAINGLVTMRYTREAESAADAYAIDRLRQAAISPDDTAAFFDKLSGGPAGEKAERAMSWMNSHPVSAERKAAFARSKVAGKDYRPALPPWDWRALKGMCKARGGASKSER
ncbi:MAG TPA: M48 family metallopeptidase [Sphingobium sp.]|nr:M48 family metallopeptidase [Sphingobium sp.]